jgi:hypothetical protein
MATITNFNFNNLKDLIDFLTNTKEFNDWETVIFRMSATNGMEMNINTQINDTSGIRSYTQLKKLKNMLNSFYTQNSYLSINFEVKLKFPNTLRKTIDPNNNYEAFYIDFYSDQILSFFTLSFVENGKILEDAPVKSWVTFITNIYNVWLDKKLNG